jgi:hypothetical protein
MSDPKQGPWEQLTEDQRRVIRDLFGMTVDDMISDVAFDFELDAEHVEVLFADWVTSSWKP